MDTINPDTGMTKAETLENLYVKWEITSPMGEGGEFRYQARPFGRIVAFYGYAPTYEEAVERLLNHKN